MIPTIPKKRKLYERIVTHFKIAADYSYLEVAKYPIGIAQVLVPLAEGCKRYAVALPKMTGDLSEAPRLGVGIGSSPAHADRPDGPRGLGLVASRSAWGALQHAHRP